MCSALNPNQFPIFRWWEILLFLFLTFHDLLQPRKNNNTTCSVIRHIQDYILWFINFQHTILRIPQILRRISFKEQCYQFISHQYLYKLSGCIIILWTQYLLCLSQHNISVRSDWKVRLFISITFKGTTSHERYSLLSGFVATFLLENKSMNCNNVFWNMISSSYLQSAMNTINIAQP